MNACRPGGSCPTCNPRPVFCQGCLKVEVENPGELCLDCAGPRCAWCAEDVEEGQTYCSDGCARADQSGDA